MTICPTLMKEKHLMNDLYLVTANYVEDGKEKRYAYTCENPWRAECVKETLQDCPTFYNIKVEKIRERNTK